MLTSFICDVNKIPDICGDDALKILARRAEEGLRRRRGTVSEGARLRYLDELKIIGETNTAKLLLGGAMVTESIKKTVYPYIIGVQNCSLILYALGVTQVYPLLPGLTDSPFERYICVGKKSVPRFAVFIPRGTSGRLAGLLPPWYSSVAEIEESDDFADLPPEKAGKFFAAPSYNSTDILKKAVLVAGAAPDFEVDDMRGLTNIIACLRTDGRSRVGGALYSDDICAMLKRFGFSDAEAERARMACAIHKKDDIEFYRQAFIQRAMLNGATIEIAEEVLSYFEKSAPYGVCRAACAATAQYLYMNVSLDETLADEEALRRRNVEIRKINFPQITEGMLKEAKEKLAGIERPSALDIQRALSVGYNVAVKLRRLIVDGGEKRD